MIRWVKKLVQSLLPGVFLSPPAPLSAPEWTALDRDRWKNFLASSTGKALMLRARARHYQNLISASTDFINPGNMAHAGRGWGECLQWLESLSLAGGATPAKNDGGQLGDAVPDEMAEFIARHSP